MTLDEILQSAHDHHNAGRLAEAEGLYRQILAAQGNHAPAMHLLGVLLGQTGRMEGGTDLVRRATQLAPEMADYHGNLGELLRRQGRYEQGLISIRRAIDLRPADGSLYFKLGAILSNLDRFDEAIAAFSQAIRLRPDWVEPHLSLGTAYFCAGRLDEAAAAFEAASRIDPHSAEAYNGIGIIHGQRNNYDAAVAAFKRGIGVQPRRPEAYNNLAELLLRFRKTEEAIAVFGKAVSLAPQRELYRYNIGNALIQVHRYEQAIAAYSEALRLDPASAKALNNLGNAYKEMGRLDEAIAAYTKAMQLEPDKSDYASNRVYAMHFHPAYDPPALLRELRDFDRRYVQPLLSKIAPHPNDRSPHRQLRIGYVSPNFRCHIVGGNLIPLLREHDHGEFEIFCYSDAAQDDVITAMFRSYADQWREIHKVPDEQVADMIRREGIDILVDLTLHMAHNRMPLFARKAAPVQVTFAGYPASTGLRTMDYRLTDPYLDPPGNDDFYSEKSIRLPDTFWCYDPQGMDLAHSPEVNPLPALAAGHVTFGCLNNFTKVTDAVLDLWKRVLDAVDGSRILILAPEGAHRQAISEKLSGRADFTPWRPRPEYLKGYLQIDIGLDTFPYNGHTTSLDSLWMGVPVVTWVGRTAVGRAGWSQLSNLKLTRLAAQSPDEFVRIAAELASDVQGLAELRASLRQRMKSSPLMDGVRFARNIEAAFRQMWIAWTKS